MRRSEEWLDDGGPHLNPGTGTAVGVTGFDEIRGLTFVPECADGIDNDLDGLVDAAQDPGCTDPSDTSEQDPALPCDDGLDNDGDNFIDLQDPACLVPNWPSEISQCQDGVDNEPEPDGHIDFDGGASIWGAPIAPADPGCLAFWDTQETAGLCGLGPELALILPLLGWARNRRRRPAAPFSRPLARA